MKQFLLLLFLCLYIPHSKALDASITYALFNTMDQPYIELYTYIVSKTITYQPVQEGANEMHAKVAMSLWFERNDSIFKYDKFILNSPVRIDSTAAFADFMDIKRYTLPEGAYTLHVSMLDMYSADTTEITFSQQINVEFEKELVDLSDITLLQAVRQDTNTASAFSKSGVYMEPLAFNYYHRKCDKLMLYSEVYNTKAILKDAFAIRYTVEWDLGGDRRRSMIVGHRKLQPSDIVPVLIQHDISSLPSGNFILTLEVRNRNLDLLQSKSIQFQRSNPLLEIAEGGVDENLVKEEFVSKLSDEKVDYSLRALIPVVPDQDVPAINSILKKRDKPEAQRYFLFVYWATLNPINPEESYNQYMNLVEIVNERFDEGFGEGFETDRGYVYLKYGPPNDIVNVDNDPSAPPYKIWIYYDFPQTQQFNVKFLFHNPSLASNQFELLHSTARGEVNNPNWQRDLYVRSNAQLRGANPVDATRVEDNWFRHADRFFSDF